MKIAYVLDGKSKLISKDIYSVPFQVYDPSGSVVKTYDRELIESFIESKTETNKPYIEPTPGVYRDLFIELKNKGYDHIIVIPRQKNDCLSYKFAEYASSITKQPITVIDITRFTVSIDEIINLLLTESTQKRIETTSFNFKNLSSMLLNLCTTLKIVVEQ